MTAWCFPSKFSMFSDTCDLLNSVSRHLFLFDLETILFAANPSTGQEQCQALIAVQGEEL